MIFIELKSGWFLSVHYYSIADKIYEGCDKELHNHKYKKMSKAEKVQVSAQRCCYEKQMFGKLFSFQNYFVLLKRRSGIEVSILYFFAVIFKEAVPA